MNSTLYLAFVAVILLAVAMVALFLLRSEEAKGFRKLFARIWSIFDLRRTGDDSEGGNGEDDASANVEIEPTIYAHSWKITCCKQEESQKIPVSDSSLSPLDFEFDTGILPEREKHFTIGSSAEACNFKIPSQANFPNTNGLVYIRCEQTDISDVRFFFWDRSDKHNFFTDASTPTETTVKNIELTDGLVLFFNDQYFLKFTKIN